MFPLMISAWRKAWGARRLLVLLVSGDFLEHALDAIGFRVTWVLLIVGRLASVKLIEETGGARRAMSGCLDDTRCFEWKHEFHGVTLASGPKRLIVWKRQTLFQERQRPFCRGAAGHSTPRKSSPFSDLFFLRAGQRFQI